MEKQVVWDKLASDDLHDIYNFLLGVSEHYADTILEALFDGANLIEKFPRIGRVVPELNLPSIRELIIEKYRLIYFVSESPEIRIVAVRHSSKPLTDIPSSGK